MRRFDTWLYAALVLVGVAVLVYFTTTRGSQARFSPHTLEYKIWSEVTLLHGSWCIYRSPPTTYPQPVVEQARQLGFISPVSVANPNWEVVSHYNEAWRDGYGTLYDLFFRRRQSFMEWCATHPDRARIFWNEMIRGLRSKSAEELSFGGFLAESWSRIRDREDFQEAIEEIRRDIARDFHPQPTLPASTVAAGKSN